MEMKKCSRGHYYDASTHQDCPYCNRSNALDMTVPLNVNASALSMNSGVDKTMPVGMGMEQWDDERTMPMGMAASMDGGTFMRMPGEQRPSGASDDGKTVAMIKMQQGIDPVVGWLVCLDGKEKGKDYQIHSDNNYIGRSDKMDICIKGDETISRENQAIIIYDASDKSFYFSPAEGRSIVRINGQAIFQTTKLQAYDKVTLGKTELLFLPLCGERFEWDAE